MDIVFAIMDFQPFKQLLPANDSLFCDEGIQDALLLVTKEPTVRRRDGRRQRVRIVVATDKGYH